MRKLFCSTFGTLVVAALLAAAPPTYARGGHGGHGGGHGGQRGKHAAAGHVKGGHGGLRARGGRGHRFVGPARGHARYAGRAYYRNRGGYWGGWGGYYGYPYYGYYSYRSGWPYGPYYGYY